MNICRTCLKTPANKDMALLEKAINEEKNYVDIMIFCLDITVTPNLKITTKLCNNCYRKIISFYKFKTLSLNNDAYLKSISSEVPIENEGISMYVDENGIKHENMLDLDEFGPSIDEDSYLSVKQELDEKYEDYEDRDSHKEVETMKEENKYEEMKDDTEETGNEQNNDLHILAPAPIKRIRAKKIKQTKVAEVKPMRQMCEECGKSVRNLKEHLAIHQPKSERQMFQCSECPKLFTTYNARKKHHRFKHLGLKLECDICHAKVVSLWNHKLRVHRPDAMRFVCVLCGHRCIAQSELDLHLTAHTKVCAYECDLCHKKFRSKDFITRHIRHVHEKLTQYQCHLCSKRFSRKDHLDNHLTTHSRDRPFVCDDCGKGFKSKDNLRKHRPIHSDVKAFRCRHCDKCFTKLNYLNVHMISHTKEKKHPCQFCGVRFGRSDHRRRHEYTAHQKHLLAE